jgi:hypothetical protein
MAGRAERLATRIAGPGGLARLSGRHSLLRLPGGRCAERLLPELSLIELRLPILSVAVLPAERLLPVLGLIESGLIEPGLAVLARGVLARGVLALLVLALLVLALLVLSLLCVLGLLGKRSLLTWMRLPEGGLGELCLRARLRRAKLGGVEPRLRPEWRLACRGWPERGVSELLLRAEPGRGERYLRARLRRPECGVGMGNLLARRRLGRERGVGELRLGELPWTDGSLAELSLRGEWRLLARLRRPERVPELCLLAKSVLRERCLRAGLRRAEGRGAKLRA